MQKEPTAKVALGVSGGIAAYKAIEVLRGLQRAGVEVRVAMTKRACEFVQPLTFRALSGTHVIVDDYSTDNPDPIAHITFSQSVDLLVVAPATANIIGKFANGIADDFLTSTYLASASRVLIAPAMNTRMWNHPATKRNVNRLKADGVVFVEPDDGEMACGTIGPGRLSEPDRIVTAALGLLRQSKTPKDLNGERLLVTVGATREELDPVRFISNRSSGKMGFAIAECAARRGADVTIIAGITSANPPRDIKLVRALSADEMARVVDEHLDQTSIFIGAAAVADYRPSQRDDQKIKKSDASLTLTLEPTRDILLETARNRRNGTLVIGFAAETENVIENARLKMTSKSLDAIVANDVSRTDSGFESELNSVTILTRDDPGLLELPTMTKDLIADEILNVVVKLRQKGKSR